MELGESRVDDGAGNLLRVTGNMVKPPVGCVVVTLTGLVHTRPDGVHVVPLTTLGT